MLAGPLAGKHTSLFHEEKTPFQQGTSKYSAWRQNKKELGFGEPPQTRKESVREGFLYTSAVQRTQDNFPHSPSGAKVLHVWFLFFFSPICFTKRH